MATGNMAGGVVGTVVDIAYKATPVLYSNCGRDNLAGANTIGTNMYGATMPDGSRPDHDE